MDLQTLIHKFEVGAGMRKFSRSTWITVRILGLVALVAGYNLRNFRNMSTQEAMDSAQLARNIAEGNGYTTFFVRPLSMYLIKQQTLAGHAGQAGSQSGDLAHLKNMHPDIANPPVYPVVLAGLMKIVPFNYAIPSTAKRFWSGGGRFLRYQPDFIISFFNQLLFLGIVASVFFLARRLFDRTIAWFTIVLLLYTELFWKFSVSGLSTILLMLIFMGLVWCLVLLDLEAGKTDARKSRLLVFAALAGLLTAIGGLTRYSFAWLILPVLGFIALSAGRQRFVLGLTAIVVFVGLMTPWLARNYSLSGLPFGTASYTIMENSFAYPEDRIQRTLEPDFAPGGANANRVGSYMWRAFWQKLVGNGRQVVSTDLPKLCGSWVSAFFLAGLLVQFRNPTVRRLRYFLLGCLFLLSIVQAVGRTQLSEDSPDLNTENLLVLLAPLVAVYGISLFCLLLDQLQLPFPQLRYVIIGLFAVFTFLPMLLRFAPPRIHPIAYPPYYPPSIQTAVGWTAEDELTMSDIPWAVAWYGQSQCVWLSLNSHTDFFALNDYQKPVSALYLTPLTIDKWNRTTGWSTVFLQCLTRLPADPNKYPVHLNLQVQLPNGTPTAFPLTYLQPGWPMQLLLTYRPHWPRSP